MPPPPRGTTWCGCGLCWASAAGHSAEWDVARRNGCSKTELIGLLLSTRPFFLCHWRCGYFSVIASECVGSIAGWICVPLKRIKTATAAAPPTSDDKGE